MNLSYDRQQTIAILSVSAGAGHVRAAQALQAATEKWYPGVKAVHLDLMELVPKLFKTIYTDTYIKVVERHPDLWGYLYDKTDHERVDSSLSKLRIAIERINTQKLKQALADIDPDHVICTHFLPAHLLSRKIADGRFNKPVWVQVTDFDLHALWVHPHMSGYFAANEEVAWRMAERGIPAELVRVTGIPIMPVFGEKRHRDACAAEFGFDPAKTTLLMMAGGAGVGGIETLAERLLKLEGDFQLVALAGRNDKLLADLQTLAKHHPSRLIPMGFTKVIERIMTASDLAITKPGGLTTSECLALGLPMIVVSPIPGQEERNADFLLENGVALKACNAGALAWKVDRLLRDPERMAAMRANAIKLGRPEAAQEVLNAVLGLSVQ